MVTSSELKYRLMRHVNFNPLLSGLQISGFRTYFMYFYMIIIIIIQFFFFSFSLELFSRHFSLYNLLSF